MGPISSRGTIICHGNLVAANAMLKNAGNTMAASQRTVFHFSRFFLSEVFISHVFPVANDILQSFTVQSLIIPSIILPAHTIGLPAHSTQPGLSRQPSIRPLGGPKKSAARFSRHFAISHRGRDAFCRETPNQSARELGSRLWRLAVLLPPVAIQEHRDNKDAGHDCSRHIRSEFIHWGRIWNTNSNSNTSNAGAEESNEARRKHQASKHRHRGVCSRGVWLTLLLIGLGRLVRVRLHPADSPRQ
jgi:hypothetical protein